MEYTVTITKKEIRKTTSKGEFQVVDERPWTQKELDDMPQAYSDIEFIKGEPLKKIRDYAPERETSVKVETEIFKQTVETLDLETVILAINGITAKS